MKRGGGIWVGVAAVFLLMALAWTGLFYAAQRAKVETVPLAASRGMVEAR